MAAKVIDLVAGKTIRRANWLKLKNAPATLMYNYQQSLYVHHLNLVQVELD